MKTEVETKSRRRPQVFAEKPGALSGIYKNLTDFLCSLEYQQSSFEEVTEQAFCVILEDDLQSLLDECEGLLFTESAIEAHDLVAFESRSITVIDEVKQFLSHLQTKH